jgi:uncharacterized repeat protein (TIGR01451 family)
MSSLTIRTSATTPSTSHSIVFVSADIQNHDLLLAKLGNDLETHLLNTDQDGVYQIAATLQGRSGLNSIHILSHGNSGTLSFGASSLNSDNLLSYTHALSQIGAALAENGDILLYGCNVAQGETGFQFIDNLAKYTHANIAGSSTLTGAEILGGDWLLDVVNTGGAVTTDPLSIPDYDGVLPNVTLPLTLSQWNYSTNTWDATLNPVTYLEGQVVPFHLQASGLTVPVDPTTTAPYAVRINMGTYQAATDAGGFLWIDTSPVHSGNPFNVIPSGSLYGTTPSPIFYTNGADIQSLTYSTDGTTLFADVIFQASATTADIYWGETLALPDQVRSPTNPDNISLGASGFTGGSLQTKIDTMIGESRYTWITPSDANNVIKTAPVQGQISGYKWNDTNGNAILDPTEAKLAGWTINLYQDNGDGNFDINTDKLIGTAITDSSGSYTFSSTTGNNISGTKGVNILLGTYFVQEVAQNGWLATTPNSYKVVIETTHPTSANNFGNRQVADLSVIKSDSPDAASNALNLTAGPDTDPANLKQGDNTFTYTIRATNNSAFTTADNVVVTDTLDPNVTFISAVGGTFADNGAAPDTFTWNPISLAPGASQDFIITVQVNAATSTTSLLNSVSITSSTYDPTLSNNTNTEPTNLIVNKLPIAVADSNTASEGGAAVTKTALTGILSNDTLGDLPATLSAASQGSTVITLGTPFTTSNGGSLTLNADGSYSYTPPPIGKVPLGGVIETFNYTLKDANGDVSSSTLTINVSDSNLLPVAVADTNTATEGGAAVTKTALTGILSNDTLGDLPATLSAASQGSTVITLGTPFTTSNGGSLTLNADGSYSYTPPPIDKVPLGGVIETFNYTLKDANGDVSSSTLTINVSDTDNNKILHIEKDATVPCGTADEVGEVINYTMTVSNLGDTSIANVQVSDPFVNNLTAVINDGFNIGDINHDGLLDVNETWQYTASHEITQADLDKGGDIVNIATVTGDGATPSTDDAKVTVEQYKALHIEKDASVSGDTADVVGEIIHYTMEVSNEGNAAISNVQVSDPFVSDLTAVIKEGFNIGDTDHDGLLDVDETWQYTASHTVTQAELDAGDKIVNTATVTGDDASPDSDTACVVVEQPYEEDDCDHNDGNDHHGHGKDWDHEKDDCGYDDSDDSSCDDDQSDHHGHGKDWGHEKDDCGYDDSDDSSCDDDQSDHHGHGKDWDHGKDDCGYDDSDDSSCDDDQSDHHGYGKDWDHGKDDCGYDNSDDSSCDDDQSDHHGHDKDWDYGKDDCGHDNKSDDASCGNDKTETKDTTDCHDDSNNANDCSTQHSTDVIDLTMFRENYDKTANCGATSSTDDAAAYSWWTTDCHSDVNPQMIDLLDACGQNDIVVGDYELPEIAFVGVPQHQAVDFIC